MAVSLRELGDQVARIDARTASMDAKLDSIIRFTTRSSSGRSLINLVEDILNKVKSL